MISLMFWVSVEEERSSARRIGLPIIEGKTWAGKSAKKRGGVSAQGGRRQWESKIQNAHWIHRSRILQTFFWGKGMVIR